MRFKQFINESSFENYEEMVGLIRRNCQQFLKESDGLPLYRGYKGSGNFLQQKNPVYRTPVDSSWADNNLFNMYIQAAFDIPHARQTAIFATGNYVFASSYGSVYYVFPFDNYEYIWAPKIKDSFTKHDSLLTLFIDYFLEYTDDMASAPAVKNWFKTIGEQWDSSEINTFFNDKQRGQRMLNDLNINIWRATNQTVEISNYDVYDIMIKSLAKVAKYYYEDNVDLANAIARGVEILFHKTNGVYLLNVDFVKKRFNNVEDSDYSNSETYYALLEDIYADI